MIDSTALTIYYLLQSIAFMAGPDDGDTHCIIRYPLQHSQVFRIAYQNPRGLRPNLNKVQRNLFEWYHGTSLSRRRPVQYHSDRYEAEQLLLLHLLHVAEFLFHGFISVSGFDYFECSDIERAKKLGKSDLAWSGFGGQS